MGLTIDGVSIDNLEIKKKDAGAKMEGRYELLGSNGTVLAKQSFNTYGGIDIAHSAETQQAMNTLRVLVAKDINNYLGLGENNV